MYTYKLYFDGSTPINPGISGYGGIITKNDKEIFNYHGKINICQSNNYAEYYALYKGMLLALKKNIKDIKVYGDSELVINQMNKVYRIKSDNLIELYKKCQYLKSMFHKITFTHIKRNFNKRADELSKLCFKK